MRRTTTWMLLAVCVVGLAVAASRGVKGRPLFAASPDIAAPELGARETAAADSAVPAVSEPRHFAVFLAHQSSENAIKYSHSFAVFVQTRGEGPERRIEKTCTISWFPKSEHVSIIRPAEPGVNQSLEQTLAWAAARDLEVSVLGPYEVDAELFERATRQVERLSAGEFQYRTNDTRTRATAKNCIHALSDIVEDEGRLETGTARGLEATQMVVEHFRRHIVGPGGDSDANLVLVGLDLARFQKPNSTIVAVGGGQ